MENCEHLAAIAPWMDCVAVKRDLVEAEDLLRRLAEMRAEARREADAAEVEKTVQS